MYFLNYNVCCLLLRLWNECANMCVRTIWVILYSSRLSSPPSINPWPSEPCLTMQSIVRLVGDGRSKCVSIHRPLQLGSRDIPADEPVSMCRPFRSLKYHDISRYGEEGRRSHCRILLQVHKWPQNCWALCASYVVLRIRQVLIRDSNTLRIAGRCVRGTRLHWCQKQRVCFSSLGRKWPSSLNCWTS